MILLKVIEDVVLFKMKIVDKYSACSVMRLVSR